VFFFDWWIYTAVEAALFLSIGLLFVPIVRGSIRSWILPRVMAPRRTLVHKIGKEMQSRGSGRILFTGSIAGFMPGTFQAVYNGTKAFIDSFSFALRNELKDSGVTVSVLMPGATDTEFFARADMLDTKVGAGKKDDPADVAKVGFKAMMAGEGDVVAGLKNKVQATVANVTPASVLAEMHRKQAEPGSAKQKQAEPDTGKS
jgi:short-subunit dehydrogenase